MVAAFVLTAIAGIASSAQASAGSIEQLKDEAVKALTAERNLTSAPEGQDPNTASDEFREKVKAADDRGVELLAKLVAAGYEPSPVVRDTLGRLPRPNTPGPPAPTRERYDVAIFELGGERGVPPGPKANDSGWTGSMIALVAAVAALSAIAAVALVVVVRRRKDGRLVEMAITDSLTELYNRRRLDEDLTVCSTKTGMPVGVLMVDVDNFKTVNDTRGHSAGDRVLQGVGRALSRNVRPQDVVYRYGGEEFCVLLPNATETDAVRVAERIRLATSELRLPGLDAVTVSVGVAIGDGVDVQQTLERADAAMFEAKRDGRDRVALAAVAISSGMSRG